MKTKAVLIGFLWYCAGPAWAQRFQTGETITISQPVNGDLYIAGNTVTINAPIRGDLIAAGGTITINDSIAGDLLLAGSEVSIDGFVGDDIRCVAGTIRLTRAVVGDAVVAGSQISLEAPATISGALLAAAGKLKLYSSVGQEARIAFGDLLFTGQVGGILQGRGGKAQLDGQVRDKATLITDELRVGPKASFGQGVRYWNQGGPVAFGASVGNPVFDATLSPDAQRSGGGFAWAALLFLGMTFVLIALISFLLTNDTKKKAAQMATTNSLAAIGTGFLFFLGVPVIMVISYASIVGIPVGVLLLFTYLAAFIVAPAITAIVLTGVIRNRTTNPAWGGRQFLLTALGVGFLIHLLWAVPFLGWIIYVGLTCLAFGALLLQIRLRKAAPTEPRHLELTTN